MRVWMVNAEELEDDTGRYASQAEFLREVIEAATSRACGPRWRSAVRCNEPSGGRRCRGRMMVSRDEPSVVGCLCYEGCQVGTIGGFENTSMDMSIYIPRERMVCWGIDEESRQVLRAATVEKPALRAVIARASPHAEVRGLLVVPAAVRELSAMYSLVESLLDVARGKRRHELLSELLSSLCTSIDGF